MNRSNFISILKNTYFEEIKDSLNCLFTTYVSKGKNKDDLYFDVKFNSVLFAFDTDKKQITVPLVFDEITIDYENKSASSVFKELLDNSKLKEYLSQKHGYDVSFRNSHSNVKLFLTNESDTIYKFMGTISNSDNNVYIDTETNKFYIFHPDKLTELLF